MSAATEQTFQAPPPPKTEAGPKAPRPTQLRPGAIALFVIGVLLVVGQATTLLPGALFPGVGFCVWGLILFGLSFIRLPQVDSKEPPLSTSQRLMGIFYEPTRVFRDLRARPHWVAAFIVVALLTLAYSAGFVYRVTPERIVNFTTDKVAESGFLTPDQVEAQRQIRLEQARSRTYQAMQHLTNIPVTFIKYAAFAAIVMLGVLAFGGRMNYWQALAAVLFAVLPWTVIQKVLSIGLLYLKSPEDIHPLLNQDTLLQDNLGVLFSPSEHPVIFVLASAVGLTFIYWLWLMARALRFTATKSSGSAAWGVTITLAVLMVGIGAIMAALFGRFMGS